MGIPEVLLARMASGFESRSSSRKTVALISGFSGTASIMRSASVTASARSACTLTAPAVMDTAPPMLSRTY